MNGHSARARRRAAENTADLLEHLPRLTRPKRTTGRPPSKAKPENRKIDTDQEGWLRNAAFKPIVPIVVKLLADNDHKTTGAPRQYHDFAMVVIYLLNGRYRVRQITESILIQRGAWRIVLEAYEHHYGERPPWEMDVPPSRRQYMYFRDRRLAPLLPDIHHVMRTRAIDMALEMGAFDPSVPRSLTKPDRAHTIYGDGTVLGAVRKPKKPASVIPGVIPDDLSGLGLSWATEGGATSQTLGHYYAATHVRLDDTNERRITTDVRPVREQLEGGEAALGTQMVCDLHDWIGSQGRIDAALWDGAMRGKHASRIMQHTGALPMHRIRTDEKPRSLDLVMDCGCGVVHELFTDQQTICTKKVDGEGKTTFVPVPGQRIEVRGRAGMHRVYVSFTLVCGNTRRVRVDEDVNERGINVAERVQPLAPHQPGWCYTWRTDAETSHSELDRSLPWKRMPYVTPVNQDLFMLACVMLRNERTNSEWLVRRAEAAESLAS